MSVQVALWRQGIETRFYDTNEHLLASTDVSSEVLRGAVIYIPQSGFRSKAKRNRATLPATIVRRTDTSVVYELDSFTSDPMAVSDMEQAEISYDKMQSMIAENGGDMFELAGLAILESWAKHLPVTADRMIDTSLQYIRVDGLPVDISRKIEALDGNFKRACSNDFLKAQAIMNRQKVDKSNRFFIGTTEMIHDLKTDPEIKSAFNAIVDYKSGEFPRYAGFAIIERSDVIRLRANGLILPPDIDDDELSPLDTIAGLFIQKSCVEHGLGDRGIYHNPSDVQFYGQTMSMMVRGGGRHRRSTHEGVLIYRYARVAV